MGCSWSENKGQNFVRTRHKGSNGPPTKAVNVECYQLDLGGSRKGDTRKNQLAMTNARFEKKNVYLLGEVRLLVLHSLDAYICDTMEPNPKRRRASKNLSKITSFFTRKASENASCR